MTLLWSVGYPHFVRFPSQEAHVSKVHRRQAPTATGDSEHTCCGGRVKDVMAFWENPMVTSYYCMLGQIVAVH